MKGKYPAIGLGLAAAVAFVLGTGLRTWWPVIPIVVGAGLLFFGLWTNRSRKP